MNKNVPKIGRNIAFSVKFHKTAKLIVCVAGNEDDEREILPYIGNKSKSEVWKYFGFYRTAASPLMAQNLHFVKSRLQTLLANVRQ